MTAGQGDHQGRPEGEGGQQPGWPPPPPQGQPPYGAGPYGQEPQGRPPYGPGQPPYGQHPYGYAPAPAAPGWDPDAPAPMERPVTVRAGIGAFVAALVLSAVGTGAMLLNWDRFTAWMIAESGTDLDSAEFEGLDTEAFTQLTLQVTVAVSVVVLLLQALFLWFAWQGRNWARVVLWVLGGLTLLSVPFSAGSSGPLPFVTALTWFQIALTAVGVVLLAAKASNDWYRFRKWQFATGRH
ncbi:hypothetical protein [Blastococcus sp. SYSU DS0539]